ncbi:MAG: SDR family NAD(P)-dependent oxidoreductase, partial [Halanaerobiales bacterium]
MVANFDLTGKTAVITGGGGILCGEMAVELADRGVKVAVLDINHEKINEVVADIKNNGGKAIGIRTDVLDRDSLKRARKKVLAKFGEIDILINGAGGNRKEATTDEENDFFALPEPAIASVFNLNFMGTVLTSQVFGEVMAQKGKGSIINVSSMAANIPLTKTIAYSAAKSAVSNFTMWLAVHLNQNYATGLRVNAIAPGFLLTEQNKYL